MKMASKVLVVAVVLLGMTAAGCQKKIMLTFRNTTDMTLPVKVATPDAGMMNAGAVGGLGSLDYPIRLMVEDLPATCTASVGIRTKSFTVTRDTDDHLWFINTVDGLAGPMGKDAAMTVIKQTGEVRIKTTIGTIVD